MDFEPPERQVAVQTALSVYDVVEEPLAAPTEPEPPVAVTRAPGLTDAGLEPRQEEPPVVDVALQIPSTPEADPVAPPAALDLREVTGNRVNMRDGPGTGFAVVGQLVRGDGAEVLEDPGTGWVKLRDLATGQEGWMSARFLTSIDG